MPTRANTGNAALSRDEIIQQALVYAQARDLRSLSLRQLARDLDVTPMALYRHVRDKDDLLEAVADVLLAEEGIPQMKQSWRRFLEGIAESLRAVLSEHPEIAELIARQPLTTPAARARFRTATAALERAGWRRDRAVRAYAAVHTYTVGYCVLEAGRRSGRAAAPTRPAEDVDADVDEEASAIAGFVSDEQFRFGLRALLAGLDDPRR